MNAQVQPTVSRALTLAERATSAIAISKTESQLAELAASTATIVEITNPAGYQQVHSARMTLKTQRVEIEKAGKQAREDATAFRNAVIAAEQKLIAIIEPEEERLHTLQKKWDAAREAEKAEKAAAEKARVAAIHERMAELRGNQTLSSLHASSLISEHLRDLEALAVDESYQEFQVEAAAIKDSAVARLSQLLNAARAREADEQRLAEERAQLERDKAEAKRVDGIKTRIAYIFSIGAERPRTSTKMVAALLEEARALVIDDSYQEFREQAQAAKDSVVTTLETVHAERIEHEKEESRLAAERAELDRLRKEQEDRIAAEERAAKERLEAEAAEQRRQQAAAEHEARAKREAEEAELARQREAIEAEQRRIAEESAALEQQRADAQEIVVSGSVNAVGPDQPHGEGNAEIVASPGDGLGTANSAPQVAETVASPLTSTIDLFDPRIRPMPPADMPSADEIIFALMQEFSASRETVLVWLASVTWGLQA